MSPWQWGDPPSRGNRTISRGARFLALRPRLTTGLPMFRVATEGDNYNVNLRLVDWHAVHRFGWPATAMPGRGLQTGAAVNQTAGNCSRDLTLEVLLWHNLDIAGAEANLAMAGHIHRHPIE